MQIEACGSTNIGKLRERNEDAFLIDNELSFYIVCDGMGGQAAGDVASLKATEYVAEYIRNNASVIQDIKKSKSEYYKLFRLAETATIETCRKLYELASLQPEYAGMGTTMTLIVIVNDKAVMSHVGDSRLYFLRDNELHLLSSDHTMANELLQTGVLTPEEFENHPFRHYLTRSVGSAEAVESELLLFDILPGDTLLLCSDGLSRYFSEDKEIIELLQQDNLTPIPEALLQIANDRGGRDNITAVVVRVTANGSLPSRGQDTRIKVDALKSMYLCDKLSYKRLIRLVEISEIRNCEKDTDVLKANDICEGLYLIVDGRVIIPQEDNEPKVFNRGDYFCETALVRMRRAKASVKTLESSKLLIIPRKEFQVLIQRFPKMGRALQSRLLESLGKRLDDAVEFV